jgi:prolyl oligopeptidase
MALLSSIHSANKINYPKTAKEKVIDTYFGAKVQDPYRWLENDTSAATAMWVKAQNKVTNDYLNQIPFRNDLKKRLTNLSNYQKYTSPFKKNGQYFYYKNNGLQNQSVLYRQATLTSEPEIMLDPNTLSMDGTVALTNISFSKDGKYLQYSIARSGSDWNEIYVMDAKTKTILPDHILWSKFNGVSWQGNGFYYSAYAAPEKGKEYSNKNEYEKIYYHTVGQLQSEDKLIYENKSFPLRECGSRTTEDEKYLIVYETETTTGNSLMVKDLSDPTAQFIQLATGFDNDYSLVENVDNKLYILTNWKAPKNRIVQVDLSNPARENWKVIIPETENVLVSATIVGGIVLTDYMKDATNFASAFDLTGKKLYDVQLPGLGSLSGLSGDKNDNEAFYIFSSYTFPPTIYRFDVLKNISTVFQKAEVAFRVEDYVSEQVFYKSKDGTKVPMSVTYKKGMTRNGKNPLMLYGYGGFNISLNPTFSVNRIPFLENGGIYVVANIRGGGEYGEAWHLAGTKMKKQNVFDDFIAAAEYLIANGYTNSKKLAIDGGSNGGLLVGACMTQRPELFAVAIPEVGVLDMLRYHQFTIGWSWSSDYGTSEESKEMFEYLKAYSPLHNIAKGKKYPATMVMTGDHDDRVVPAHSFKFAATLQAENTNNNPTFIRIDSKAGHGAGKPIGKIIDAQTDLWSFVMFHLGMKPKF